MFRHVVFFHWSDRAAPETVSAAVAGLAGLPSVIPQIRRYEMGPEAGLLEDTPDFVLVADFDSEREWREYADHPEHRRVLTELLDPITSRRERAQYRFDPTTEPASGEPAQ